MHACTHSVHTRACVHVYTWHKARRIAPAFVYTYIWSCIRTYGRLYVHMRVRLQAPGIFFHFAPESCLNFRSRNRIVRLQALGAVICFFKSLSDLLSRNRKALCVCRHSVFRLIAPVFFFFEYFHLLLKFCFVLWHLMSHLIVTVFSYTHICNRFQLYAHV
jgi:hypothetical protein